MPTIFFGGPEGGGKTALVTRFCRYQHLLGGEIWSFPGYELKNERGRVVSKLVMPHEIMGKVDDLTHVTLVIDEIQLFMNHHAWQNPLIDILVYGAWAQRRKRQFATLVTGPFFYQLPPDMRDMFHVVFKCEDKHWKNHKIARGTLIRCRKTDMRGILSGREFTTTRPQVFRPERYFKYYNTFSLVDPKYQQVRIQVQKEKVYLDAEGNVVEPPEKRDREIESVITSFLQMNGEPESFDKGSLFSFVKLKLGRCMEDRELQLVGKILPQFGYEAYRQGKGFKLYGGRGDSVHI